MRAIKVTPTPTTPRDLSDAAVIAEIWAHAEREARAETKANVRRLLRKSHGDRA